MDKENLADLMAICPEEDRGKIKLFLSFTKDSRFEEVPRPLLRGQTGFELVFDLAQQTSEALLEYISNTPMRLIPTANLRDLNILRSIFHVDIWL